MPKTTPEQKKKRAPYRNANICKNKEVLQSYILTTAKYDFSRYEKMALYRIVEQAQRYVDGLNFKNGKDLRPVQVNYDLFGSTEIPLPITTLMDPDQDYGEQYNLVRKAINKLRERTIEYEDDRIIIITGIVEAVQVKKYNREVKFRLNPLVWDACLNFTQGFRAYELKTAMSFKSTYTMRMYELLSHQQIALTYSLDAFRDMFALGSKYALLGHLLTRVVEPAKKELDASSPYTFTYELLCADGKTLAGRGRGKSAKFIRLHPIHQPEFEDPDIARHKLQKQYPVSYDIGLALKDYLLHNCHFEDAEIRNNIDLFVKLAKLPDAINLVAGWRTASLQPDVRNSKAYIIGCAKKYLEKLAKRRGALVKLQNEILSKK